MPRQSQQQELTAALCAYLAEAKKHSPEEYPLECPCPRDMQRDNLKK